jgi:predicted deacylase
LVRLGEGKPRYHISNKTVLNDFSLRFLGALRETLPVQRLGKNIGGYHGETIEIQKVLREIEQAAGGENWTRDPVPAPVEFIAWRRAVASPRRRIYISAGIHGDEPAGPLAALQLLRENHWPGDDALWLCPCLNPSGFPLNRRENSGGIDLNRDYRHRQSAEVRAHVQWLRQQPDFDLVLCLHEDWESRGFYLYELNPDHRPSLAESIIEAVAAVCPVDQSPVIEDRPAQNGIIRPVFNPMDRPQWPEALYLAGQNKTRLSYTFEAPSDFPMATRVAALATAVRAALRLL